MLRLRGHRPAAPLAQAKISITFYPDTRRTFDLSNAAESVMDLLVDAEILSDDNWSVVPDLTLHFGAVDPKNPRAEIDIARSNR